MPEIAPNLPIHERVSQHVKKNKQMRKMTELTEEQRIQKTIAEHLGWTKVSLSSHAGYKILTGCAPVIDDSRRDRPFSPQAVPDWTGDLSLTWELVREELPDRSAIRVDYREGIDSKMATCATITVGEPPCIVCCKISSGDQPALALCMALLAAWKRKDVNDGK